MHAANLLNKKRQREAEKEKQQHHAVGSGTPAGAGTPTTSTPNTKHQNSKQHLLVDSQSQSSSSMIGGGPAAAAGGASPMPPRHHIPGPIVDYPGGDSRQCQSTSATCIHHQQGKQKKKKKYQPTKLVDDTSNTSAAVPTPLYYQKDEHFNCAHVGLCIMILGVIIMTITGFVSHMLGFGEPGIIIVTGGACFCAVGLFLLCFGNAWYIRRSTKKAGLLSFIEIGRTASFDGNVVP